MISYQDHAAVAHSTADRLSERGELRLAKAFYILAEEYDARQNKAKKESTNVGAEKPRTPHSG